MLSFIRAADKLLIANKASEFKSGYQRTLLDVMLSGDLADDERDDILMGTVLRMQDTVGTPEYAAAALKFAPLYEKYRALWKCKIENAIMKGKLQLLLPFIADREKTNGIKSASLSMSKSISALIESSADAIDELETYRTLFLIWKKAHTLQAAGEDDSKYIAAARTLQSKLAFELSPQAAEVFKK